MAARKSLSHDQKTREKIQTSQLINRLTDHVFDKIDLTSTQIKAAEILLRKSLPDLQAVQHTGEDGGAIQITEIRRTIVSPDEKA